MRTAIKASVQQGEGLRNDSKAKILKEGSMSAPHFTAHDLFGV